MNDMVTDQLMQCWDWTLILKNECNLMRHWGFEICPVDPLSEGLQYMTFYSLTN